MKATQVFVQAKHQARQQDIPYVVYVNCQGEVTLRSIGWGEAIAGIASSLPSTGPICGFAFPCGRFEGVYR